jgi:diacylglycerol kinase
MLEVQFGWRLSGLCVSTKNVENFQSHSVICMYVYMLQLVPGPPFVFGAFLVICALLVAVFIPDGTTLGNNLRTSSRRQSGKSLW